MSKPRRSSFDVRSALVDLRAGRAGALSVCMSVKINSAEYRAADSVIEAVDDLVACLTGDSTLLHASAHKTLSGSKISDPQN